MIDTTPHRRLSTVIAAAVAIAALALLIADTVAHDQAVLLGAVTLAFLSVTIYFLGADRAVPDSKDSVESVKWGMLFVGLIYASLTVFFALALCRTPEITHALHLVAMAL